MNMAGAIPIDVSALYGAGDGMLPRPARAHPPSVLNDDPRIGHNITPQQAWEQPVPMGEARFRPASPGMPVMPPSNQELESP